MEIKANSDCRNYMRRAGCLDLEYVKLDKRHMFVEVLKN